MGIYLHYLHQDSKNDHTLSCLLHPRGILILLPRDVVKNHSLNDVKSVGWCGSSFAYGTFCRWYYFSFSFFAALSSWFNTRTHTHTHWLFAPPVTPFNCINDQRQKQGNRASKEMGSRAHEVAKVTMKACLDDAASSSLKVWIDDALLASSSRPVVVVSSSFQKSSSYYSSSR